MYQCLQKKNRAPKMMKILGLTVRLKARLCVITQQRWEQDLLAGNTKVMWHPDRTYQLWMLQEIPMVNYFSLIPCIVCPSLIYSFWLPLWCLQIFLTEKWLTFSLYWFHCFCCKLNIPWIFNLFFFFITFYYAPRDYCWGAYCFTPVIPSVRPFVTLGMHSLSG